MTRPSSPVPAIEAASTSRFSSQLGASLKFFRKVAALGMGEGVARLAAFLLVVFVSRSLGVERMGAYIAASAVAQYALLGTDFGFKTIGARLLANWPGHRGEIVSAVQRQRLRMTLVVLPISAAYALFGPLPAEARLVALVLICTAVPQALSVDWILWGVERFGWLSAWRAGVALLTLALAATGVLLFGPQLFHIAIAQWLAAAVGAVALLGVRRTDAGNMAPLSPDAPKTIASETAWRRAGWTGTAVTLNLFFQSGDTLILAALSTPSQVGLYSAAYKFVYMVTGAYYLFTSAALPALARTASSQARHIVLRWSGIAFLAGIGIAAAGLATADTIVRLLYGPGFHAAVPLLRILAFAVPFEFAAALLGLALTAWGRTRAVTLILGIATISNLVLNLWLIPSYGATAAAWNTVACYALLVACLVTAFVGRGERSASPEGAAL